MHRQLRFVLTGVCLAVPLQLSGQACLGAASFGRDPVRLGAGVSASQHVNVYDLDLAAGSSQGPFASAALSRVEYDNVSDVGTGLDVLGGFAINLTPEKNFLFCPLVGFAHQSGPDFETTFGHVSVSTQSVAFGGSFGGTVPVSRNLAFVPFAEGLFVNSQETDRGGGVVSSGPVNYGEINIGAGWVVNRTLTFQTSMSVPVGLNGAETSYRFGFGINFGGSPGRR
jgi:hypothetical protein